MHNKKDTKYLQQQEQQEIGVPADEKKNITHFGRNI
jgi:hypothetical protein